MKRILLIIPILLVLSAAIYIGWRNGIDTVYAKDFAEVFGTYDIAVIDGYLSDTTQIICNEKNNSYKELRNNVKIACEKKQYEFYEGSSYGHGNNTFVDGVQDVKVFLYGTFNGISIGECNIEMKLKRNGLFGFEIESLECNDPVFENLFYTLDEEE